MSKRVRPQSNPCPSSSLLPPTPLGSCPQSSSTAPQHCPVPAHPSCCADGTAQELQRAHHTGTCWEPGCMWGGGGKGEGRWRHCSRTATRSSYGNILGTWVWMYGGGVDGGGQGARAGQSVGPVGRPELYPASPPTTFLAWPRSKDRSKGHIRLMMMMGA